MGGGGCVCVCGVQPIFSSIVTKCDMVCGCGAVMLELIDRLALEQKYPQGVRKDKCTH
jgi:hypothetical protein